MFMASGICCGKHFECRNAREFGTVQPAGGKLEHCRASVKELEGRRQKRVFSLLLASGCGKGKGGHT